MRNVRLEDGVLVYDCDGVGCPTPGEPHTLELHKFFAALEASYREFVLQEDPRAEAVDIATQLVYQLIYKSNEAYPMGSKAPWNDEFHKLVTALDAHYEALVQEEEVEKPDKEFLN